MEAPLQPEALASTYDYSKAVSLLTSTPSPMSRGLSTATAVATSAFSGVVPAMQLAQVTLSSLSASLLQWVPVVGSAVAAAGWLLCICIDGYTLHELREEKKKLEAHKGTTEDDVLKAVDQALIDALDKKINMLWAAVGVDALFFLTHVGVGVAEAFTGGIPIGGLVTAASSLIGAGIRLVLVNRASQTDMSAVDMSPVDMSAFVREGTACADGLYQEQKRPDGETSSIEVWDRYHPGPEKGTCDRALQCADGAFLYDEKGHRDEDKHKTVYAGLPDGFLVENRMGKVDPNLGITDHFKKRLNQRLPKGVSLKDGDKNFLCAMSTLSAKADEGFDGAFAAYRVVISDQGKPYLLFFSAGDCELLVRREAGLFNISGSGEAKDALLGNFAQWDIGFYEVDSEDLEVLLISDGVREFFTNETLNNVLLKTTTAKDAIAALKKLEPAEPEDDRAKLPIPSAIKGRKPENVLKKLDKTGQDSKHFDDATIVRQELTDLTRVLAAQPA